MSWYGDDASQYRISMRSQIGRPDAKPFVPFVPQINANHPSVRYSTKKITTSVAGRPYADNSDNDEWKYHGYPSNVPCDDGYNNCINHDKKEGAKPFLDAAKNNNHDGYGYGGNKEGPKPKPSVSPIYFDNGYGSYDVGNGKDKRFLRNEAGKYGYRGGYKPREYEYDDNKAHHLRQDGPGPLSRRPMQQDDVKKGMEQEKKSGDCEGCTYWASTPVINTYVHMSGITF